MAFVRNLRLVSRLSSMRQSAHGHAMSTKGTVVELRIYELKPEYFKPFLELIEKHWHIRCADSKSLGFWISDLGGINEVIHMWQYDSLIDRALKRKKLLENKEWQKGFLPKFFPMCSKMTNALLSVTEGSKLTTDFTQSSPAVYELQICEGQYPQEKVYSSEFLVGRFTGVYGPINTEYLLFRYIDGNTAFNHALQRNQGKSIKGYSRFMIPSAWSPMK
ncbi:protein NipSnap homolog 3A-like isoform X1 [Pomacea canaliculata]|uniref:protein NipSnap homolog 3A-like isoform X1 n=2 Tax=Pomacea canaliculata TaxID=400727 RepID=UPI000D72B1D2|nr:protein NipSnap homolog 3A-like isoform X1 [Pomacea canaliculata]